MKKLIIGLVLITLLVVPLSCSPEPPKETSMQADRSESLGPAWGEEEEEEEEWEAEDGEGRMIVRNGDVSLVVEDVVDARDKITQLATGLDGYVVSSQITGEEEENRIGYISIRVPDNKFEQALDELRSLATRITLESTSSRDITEEYIDLKARLKNAEATESQYLALLEKATDVEDILNIYESLSRVRREIEQIRGQMLYLERTSSMSLITIRLKPSSSEKPLVRVGWSMLEVLKSALRGIITFGQWLATLFIWMLIFVPIWGTALGIFLWRRRKKRPR
jgi:hypothetical protein